MSSSQCIQLAEGLPLPVYKMSVKPYKAFGCTHCHLKFGTRNSLSNHEETHSGKPFFSCVACHKFFKNQEELYTHSKIHRQTKFRKVTRIYKCLLCNKQTFNSVSQLSRHVNETHYGNRRYRCTICTHDFTRPHGLKRHMRIHMNYKRFQCLLCYHRFTEKGNLKSHMRFRHKEVTDSLNLKEVPESDYCLWCKSSFVNEVEYKTHLLDCLAFEEVLVGPQNKNKHFKQPNENLDQSSRKILNGLTGPHACQYCKLQFASLTILENHLYDCKEFEAQLLEGNNSEQDEDASH